MVATATSIRQERLTNAYIARLAALALLLAFAATQAQAHTFQQHLTPYDPLQNPASTLNSASVATLESTTTNGATFQLFYGNGLAHNPDAEAAFNRSVQRWADVLQDPVTVKINVDMRPMDDGILGSTNTTWMHFSFSEIRNLLSSNLNETNNALENSLLPYLPTAGQFDASLPWTQATFNNMSLTQANYHALGGISGTGADASITFAEGINWDFDPRDGINPTAFDFEGAVTHEIGHALGFISEIDYVDWVAVQDRTSEAWPWPLDLFRFSPDDLQDPDFNFATTTRNLVPGGSHAFYADDIIIPMATGYYLGDHRQGSHWKDDLGLGIMDPTADYGELLSLSQNDLLALDLIGWDVIPEPSCLILLSTGLLIIPRRRQPRHPNP